MIFYASLPLVSDETHELLVICVLSCIGSMQSLDLELPIEFDPRYPCQQEKPWSWQTETVSTRTGWDQRGETLAQRPLSRRKCRKKRDVRDVRMRFDGLTVDFHRFSKRINFGKPPVWPGRGHHWSLLQWSSRPLKRVHHSVFCVLAFLPCGLNFNKTPKVSGSIWTPKATCRLEWIWKIWKADFWETKLIWLCQGPFSSQQMALWYCPQRDPWEQALKFSFKKRIVVPRRRCYSMCGRL